MHLQSLVAPSHREFSSRRIELSLNRPATNLHDASRTVARIPGRLIKKGKSGSRKTNLLGMACGSVFADGVPTQPSSPATRRGASRPAPFAGKPATLTAQKTAPLRRLRAPFASPVLLGDSLVGRPGTRPTPHSGVRTISLCRPVPPFTFAAHSAPLVLWESSRATTPLGSRCGAKSIRKVGAKKRGK